MARRHAWSPSWGPEPAPVCRVARTSVRASVLPLSAPQFGGLSLPQWTRNSLRAGRVRIPLPALYSRSLWGMSGPGPSQPVKQEVGSLCKKPFPLLQNRKRSTPPPNPTTELTQTGVPKAPKVTAVNKVSLTPALPQLARHPQTSTPGGPGHSSAPRPPLPTPGMPSGLPMEHILRIQNHQQNTTQNSVVAFGGKSTRQHRGRR